jgi:hypothetical protein
MNPDTVLSINPVTNPDPVMNPGPKTYQDLVTNPDQVMNPGQKYIRIHLRISIL